MTLTPFAFILHKNSLVLDFIQFVPNVSNLPKQVGRRVEALNNHKDISTKWTIKEIVESKNPKITASILLIFNSIKCQ